VKKAPLAPAKPAVPSEAPSRPKPVSLSPTIIGLGSGGAPAFIGLFVLLGLAGTGLVLVFTGTTRWRVRSR
jgi:hypothetical protein